MKRDELTNKHILNYFCDTYYAFSFIKNMFKDKAKHKTNTYLV